MPYRDYALEQLALRHRWHYRTPLLLLAALLAIAILASGCSTCPKAGVTMHGTPPAGADRIVARAMALWPSLRVEVYWVDAPLPGCQPGESYPKGVAGCTHFGTCGWLGAREDVHLTVVRIEPVEASALAHETCHASHTVTTEEEAAACAARLNAP